jgi:hypothetical protein
LIKEVAYDMIPFTMFLLMALLMVGTSMYFLNSVDTSDVYGNYEVGEADPMYLTILSIYLLTYGDYNTDDYQNP